LDISDKNKYLAVAILVGGKSTRFGSDKGLFEFRGKHLISYQLETLADLRKNIFIVANSTEQLRIYFDAINLENITGFIMDEPEILNDKNLRTPMLGMYSVFKELTKLNYDKVLILSCDLPFIKNEVLSLIFDKAEGHDCVIPRWDNDYLEPLFAIYPVKKALIATEYCLKNKLYKLTNILQDDWKTNYLSIERQIKQIDPNLISLANINEISDLEYFNS